MLRVRVGNVKPPRMPKSSTEDHLDASLVRLSARMMLRTRHEHGSVGPSQISLFQPFRYSKNSFPLASHVTSSTRPRVILSFLANPEAAWGDMSCRTWLRVCYERRLSLSRGQTPLHARRRRRRRCGCAVALRALYVFLLDLGTSIGVTFQDAGPPR